METASTRLLQDCGPGIAAALSAVTHATELDGVVVSHPHADHCYTHTGMTDAAVRLAADADSLLAEATRSEPDGTEHGHLSGGDAGRIAARAGVRELALTHFVRTDEDWLRQLHDHAGLAYSGTIRLVRAGERVRVAAR